MHDDAAELALLRRRAFGPDADIGDDPAALARLDELETRVRARFAHSSAAELPEAPIAAADVVLEERGLPAAAVIVGRPADPPRRLGWRTAVTAGVAALAVVVVAQAVIGPPAAPTAASPEATAPADAVAVRAADDSEMTLVEIPLDRSLARYVDQPATPQFPVAGGLRWAESLGAYYGWTVWLARSDAGERCILLDRGDKNAARCSSEERFLGGLLDVTLPYGDVAPEYRPTRMAGGQTLVFRWSPERGVSIVLGLGDITYFGDNG